jgi:hypothetical protein
MIATVQIANAGRSKVFATEAAALAAVAAIQTEADEEATYEVRVDPKGTGKALVAVLIDGEFVDYL